MSREPYRFDTEQIYYYMYYKIVSKRTFFNNLLPESMDVFSIPYGMIFTAPYKPKYRPDSSIVFDETQLCFANGALDTMLWYTQFAHHGLEHVEVYEIESIGNLSCHRCLTSTGLYQCFAPHIKFLKKQNIDEMYELALTEYNDTFKTKYNNFDICLDSWKKHKPTVFLIKRSYGDTVMQLKRQYEVQTREQSRFMECLLNEL